ETVAVWPRSTCSHCGSAAALDQRVAVRLPSTAAEAGVPPFSVEDAVAVLPCEMRVSAADADRVVVTAYVASTRMGAAAAMMRFRRRRCAVGGAAVCIFAPGIRAGGSRQRHRGGAVVDWVPADGVSGSGPGTGGPKPFGRALSKRRVIPGGRHVKGSTVPELRKLSPDGCRSARCQRVYRTAGSEKCRERSLRLCLNRQFLADQGVLQAGVVDEPGDGLDERFLPGVALFVFEERRVEDDLGERQGREQI